MISLDEQNKQQYLLGRSADPDAVNTLGETADRVSGAGLEAFELLQEARQQKQGAHTQESTRVVFWFVFAERLVGVVAAVVRRRAYAFDGC